MFMWTSESVAYVRDNFIESPDVMFRIASELGCSMRQLKAKAYDLSLCMSYTRSAKDLVLLDWTSDEDHLLLENWRQGRDALLICLPAHSWYDIKKRLRFLVPGDETLFV